MANIKKIEPIAPITITDDEYVKLVSHISNLWQEARNNALQAVNTSLLMASWHTGEYIVEFEQKGESRAKYGEALLVNLSKDLTRIFAQQGRITSTTESTNGRLAILTL